MRVLKQLSNDEGSSYAKAVTILGESIYVDDVLFGADTVEDLMENRTQLIELLRKGGFVLRKWASNSPMLLDDLSEAYSDLSDHFLLRDESLKVLGISWLPSEDDFRFVVEITIPAVSTKRSILSIIAKLYDPLGWAAPVVISAKILLQELWLQKSDWDGPVSDDLDKRWNAFCLDLKSLNQLRVPRWTGRLESDLDVEIHGFADASNRAYAAVVYLRICRLNEKTQVSLLTAKTKVAPLKTISIPRLELNSLLLLSRLISWVLVTLGTPPANIYGWSDSTIALAWLRQHPSKWKTFVANRVSEIQTRMPSAQWNHVPSKENPADCASRGLPASDLSSHPLWWTGPTWLKDPKSSWPCRDLTALKTEVEVRETTVLHTRNDACWDLLSRYSNWSKLVRVTAYIRRFIARLRKEKIFTLNIPLTVSELKAAELFWFRYVQKREFAEEFKKLASSSPLPRSSPLRNLSPFVDSDSLLRLGGRLKNSALRYEEQHPIILPRNLLSDLLIDRAHKLTLHGGTQLVMRTLRQKFWIVGCRRAVKVIIHRCVRCARYSAPPCSQLMGDLPSPRVNPSKVFEHVGVDYAGPFQVTALVGRGQRARKAYVALFICLSTKAIHLELVEDCSTPAFLAAFKRFASRRGLPCRMYSDNGTNFHGADRELRRQFNTIRDDPAVRESLSVDGVDWQFIPSAAPHFGGLWEAGVKSFKTHLKRVVGSGTLSQAEFSTLLCLIEACLNSRPIAALSDDPSDLSPLTPGHFLIGRPLISAPEESVLEINPDRLSRWQLVRAMHERLWRAWSLDYLNTLQRRSKWSDASRSLREGELVLVRNHLLPPSKWELARIQRVHPGSDGLVRVVTIRTARSLLTRPITQLSRLPLQRESPEGETCPQV